MTSDQEQQQHLEFGKAEYVLVKSPQHEDLSGIELPEYVTLPSKVVKITDGFEITVPSSQYYFCDGPSGVVVMSKQRTGPTSETNRQKINLGYMFQVVKLNREDEKVSKSYGLKLALKNGLIVKFDPSKNKLSK
jgi:hypothetical protein